MTAHLCVAGGLFAAGVWKLERLQADKLHVELREALAIPAPAGRVTGQVPIPEIKPKIHITRDHVQPTTQQRPEVTPQAGDPADTTPGGGGGSGAPASTGTCTENCNPPGPKLAVCGDGAIDAGETCDDGNTANGDGCSASCQLEPKPRPTSANIAPNVLQALRIAGTTQIRPSETTQQQMVHDGVTRLIGTVKLCVAPDGGVQSASVLRPTRYDDYDRALLAAVYGWRYQPYSVGGVAIRACSTVTFIYQIQ
ncbi:MAG TPA: TonB family protein [Kofleriaceae bacterium]|nr:TonB family protein [Kofleriaceae bacterium]